jgi:hypothetical protein
MAVNFLGEPIPHVRSLPAHTGEFTDGQNKQ